MSGMPAAWERRSATAAAAGRPLPALWDGVPVEWEPWRPYAAVFACDRSRRKPPPQEVCERCDAPWKPASTTGRLKREFDPWPIAHLSAWRCPECGQDAVFDIESGESWLLDDSDYGPEGSTA